MSAISGWRKPAAAGVAGLLLATAAGGPVTAEGVRAPAPGGHRRVRLDLPVPTGDAQVGTASVRLVDRTRRDPRTGSVRELMVGLWYPARDARGPRAPWLPPAAAALYRRQTGESLRTSLDHVDFPTTHAFEGAAVAPGRHPVVLFSPGYGAVREFDTALVEDLASRGYVVVTVDHTHEASMVEFPGGRLELSRRPEEPSDADIATALRVRRKDIRFVLDELPRLGAGRNPAVPPGLSGALDLSRVGMFGHSLGGDTAAEAMAPDRRIAAGADLDGSINGAVADTGLDRPFLLMSNAGHGRDNDPSWARFWAHLRGWHRDLRLRDSGHQTYTDLAPLVGQLERALPIPPEVVAGLTDAIGTIDGSRAVAVERAYLAAFFDLHLRHRDDQLFSGPSPRYPEIEFVP